MTRPDPPSVLPRAGAEQRLSRMIQLPTVSAERDERGDAPFDDFEALLAELYPLTFASLERERMSDLGVTLRWRSDSDEPPLLLMAHFDVVPVDESDAWTHPPFAGHVSNGFVYGRGALDDKGPLLVILEAVENLLSAGFTPARDVWLTFGADEEVFGHGAREIAAEFQRRGIVPWMVVDEGGAVTNAPLPFIPGTVAAIGVGEKGLLSVAISARGEAGHASSPPKLTAVGRVARAVSRLTPSTFPSRTPRTITRMLATLAPRASGVQKLALRLLATFPPLSARVFTALGGEAAAFVRTTIAPTRQYGGTANNVLPSEATTIINLRIALGETPEAALERMRKRVGDPEVTLTALEASLPSPESDTDNEQFAALTAALHASHPGALAMPYVLMAATDSRHFHAFVPNVYRFAPLTMNNDLRATIHGVDERVAISELARGERFHRHLIASLTR